MSVIPAGGIIYRTRALADTVRVPVPYLSGGESARATIVGTRSGASVLAVWALLRHLGRQGYRSIVRRCMEITHTLAQKIRDIDELDIVLEPTINILGIRTKKGSIQPIATRLRERGWAISLFPHHIRIVCMPHVYPEHIEHFTDELRTILAGMKH
jgi:tyrosine decarboxylase/aspartate 1-decarboxylase